MNPFEGQEGRGVQQPDGTQQPEAPAQPQVSQPGAQQAYPQPQVPQPQYPQPQYPQPQYPQPQYPQQPYGQPQYTQPYNQGQYPPYPPYPQGPYIQPQGQPYPGQPYGQQYAQQPYPGQQYAQGQPYPPQGYVAPAGQMPVGQPVMGSVIQVGDAWAPVQPVVAKSRSHRFRWAIAGAIVLSVAVVTAAGAFVLSGASGSKSLTASMAPKSSFMFMELRTDLPGDQHQKLADFMSHFPGFADRAQFDNALDELFNRITNSVSPDLAYTSAFKPWMEGEVSIAVMPASGSARPTVTPISLPSGVPLPSEFSGLLGGDSMGMFPTGMGGMALSMEDAVVIIALKDRSAAQSWVTGELSRRGVSATSQTYAGETLYTIAGTADQGAYAFTSQDLILGTTAGVKASLDTKSNGSLADDSNYQTAMKSLSGDSLARFYLDPRGLLQPYLGALSTMGGAAASLDYNQIPSWTAGSMRAESDRMVIQATSPHVANAVGNHTSLIAPALPGDTVAVYEIHSVGKLVNQGLSSLSSMGPSLGIDTAQIKQVQDALALIGGVDWIGDAAVAVTDTSGTFNGGLVVSTPDAATAKTKLAMLTNFVALAGSSTGLQSSTETYKGQTITVITVPGGSGSLGNGTSVVGQTVEIALTIKDNLIVAGYQDSFAKAVIDTTKSNALSAQSDYNSVMNAVGASNEMSFYLNVPALEDELGKMATSSSSWNTNYKPYFDHLGGIGYASMDGDTSMVRIVLMAR